MEIYKVESNTPQVHLAVVGGKSVEARSGRFLESLDPATGAVVAEIPDCAEEDVAEAVASASSAFPAWRDTRPTERGRILMRMAERMLDRAPQLAALETMESGKPIEAAISEIKATARYFEYYGGLADKLHGDTIPLGESFLAYTRHEPYGVIGCIVPWNGPLNQASRSIAPALAVGNSMVLKPSELTSTSVIEFANMALDCGLPPGVLNVITGLGPRVGTPLVQHPLVRKVVFTGSVATGRLVGQLAGAKLIPAVLELGGKSANLVFADADLDAAASAAWRAISTNGGQVCSAGSRLLVERTVHDDLVARIQSIASNTSVGAGAENPTMGPMTSHEHQKKVQRYVSLAAREGASVVPIQVTNLASRVETGAFVDPVLILGATNEMRVAQEEIFGPVLIVIPFDTETEAMTLANDSTYGLVGAVWTSDVARALKFAAGLEVGQVFVNNYWGGGVETPFGGQKNSGFGREKGLEGALGYTHVKTVIVKV